MGLEDKFFDMRDKAEKFLARGKHDRAMAIYKEQERFCRKADDPISLRLLAFCLTEQAMLLVEMRRSKEAIPLAAEALELHERLGDEDRIEKSRVLLDAAHEAAHLERTGYR